jgi:Ca2+-binding RTX toxin-like protein
MAWRGRAGTIFAIGVASTGFALVAAAPAHAIDPCILEVQVVINGTPGDDVIVGTGADEVINGLGGNDHIFGNGGVDAIDGGAGDDSMFGGGCGDTILGGPGHDLLVGEDGEDGVSGGSGLDTAYRSLGTNELCAAEVMVPTVPQPHAYEYLTATGEWAVRCEIPIVY